jgi:hypothetical protein
MHLALRTCFHRSLRLLHREPQDCRPTTHPVCHLNCASAEFRHDSTVALPSLSCTSPEHVRHVCDGATHLAFLRTLMDGPKGCEQSNRRHTRTSRKLGNAPLISIVTRLQKLTLPHKHMLTRKHYWRSGRGGLPFPSTLNPHHIILLFKICCSMHPIDEKPKTSRNVLDDARDPLLIAPVQESQQTSTRVATSGHKSYQSELRPRRPTHRRHTRAAMQRRTPVRSPHAHDIRLQQPDVRRPSIARP